MRNCLKTMMLLLAVTAMMATPALAADYEFGDSEGPMYAPPTSVDQVIVVGGGETESSNIDRSKNTAVIAPPFGSPQSYLPGSGYGSDSSDEYIHRQHHQRRDNLPPAGSLR